MGLVLIAEDDSQIRKFIRFSLQSQDHVCLEATNGKETMGLIATQNPDAIILDLGLPDMDGIAIIKQLREFSSIPIIVVSARDQDTDKVEALDAGADDYLTKPFSMKELLARIRVVFRRSKASLQEDPRVYQVGGLTVDLDRHRVVLDGNTVHFTPMEYRVLTLLVKNSGKVLTYNYILHEVWGSGLESNMQTLRVFMANIRRKLEKDPVDPRYIFTEIGVGYRFTDE